MINEFCERFSYYGMRGELVFFVSQNYFFFRLPPHPPRFLNPRLSLLFCSRAGVVLEVLPAVGRRLRHHHLPHFRGSLLPDTHPRRHHSRFMARQVQVSHSVRRFAHEMEPKFSRNLLSCTVSRSFASMWLCGVVGSKCISLNRLLKFVLACLTPVYLISPTCTCLTPPPPLPLSSAQDYCLPVHRLHGGTGHPGSKCYPWHHRYEQGRHPRQHGLPRVSWTHSDYSDRRSTHTDTDVCLDADSLLCLILRSLSMVGLILIALGTGGIKPCVAAFGGDQFQDHQVRWQTCVLSCAYMQAGHK